MLGFLRLLRKGDQERLCSLGGDDDTGMARARGGDEDGGGGGACIVFLVVAMTTFFFLGVATVSTFSLNCTRRPLLL